ncbi:MAG TPA: sugar transferase [Terriglobales bacterium]|nr:sugar transferase [Terriglobales bacterium]
MKRTLDVALSVAALIALTPLFAAILLMVRLDSSGPALYRSRRAGKNGRIFTCYKFRTMRADADEIKPLLRSRNERKGPFFKIAADPRVTRVGRLLRRYSLDEIPQFWNVVRGEMSLVGPRPHPLDDVERYQAEHFLRLQVRPGMTGLWQVSARSDPSFQRSMALDSEYIERWSLGLDVRILFRTLPTVLQGSGT